MGISTILVNKLLDHFNGTTPYTPETIYLGLYSAAPSDAGGGTELTGNGYARIPHAAYNAAAAREDSNDGEILFPEATGGPWPEATHMGKFNALSGGDMLEYTALVTPRTALEGDQLRFKDTEVKFKFLASADG